jgi:hypothetical protein
MRGLNSEGRMGECPRQFDVRTDGWEANVALAGHADRTTMLQPPVFPIEGPA